MMLHRHFEAKRLEEKPEVKAERKVEPAEAKPAEVQAEEKPVRRGRSKKNV